MAAHGGFSLSQERKAQFDQFGFLLFRGLFKTEIQDLTAEFENVWKDYGGGHAGRPHDGKQRSCLAGFADRSEKLSALIDDPRILDVSTSLVGEDFNYAGSDGNFYAGDTGWHSDNWNPSPLRIKFIFYLDPLGRNSGALRVIPGSHRIGEAYADNLQRECLRPGRPGGSVFGVSAPELPAQVLDTEPGDLILFNQNLKHASFGGSKRRRMFTLNCHRRFKKEEWPQLESFVRGEGRLLLARPFGEAMLRTAGPGRKRHLEQLQELEALWGRSYEENKARLSEPSRG